MVVIANSKGILFINGRQRLQGREGEITLILEQENVFMKEGEFKIVRKRNYRVRKCHD